MKVTFFGSDSFVIPVLQALNEKFEVISVVTTKKSSIEKEAQRLGIITLTPVKLDDEFILHHSSFLSTDLFVVASYGKIIPQNVLDIPKFGGLNVHPSLLPKYRGASPIPGVILDGGNKTGVTIILMDEKMDHGPILTAKEISLSGKEDFEELITKLFHLGARTLVDIIPDFLTGKVKLITQNHKEATFTKLLTRESGYFDINNLPAGRQVPHFQERLDRMIRAYSPWPGVWTKWNNKIVKFLPLSHPALDVGSINIDSRFHPKGTSHFVMARGNDNFLIQMEGKKPISQKDFLNGYPSFPNLITKT